MSDTQISVLETQYTGRRWRLFWLALKTSMLTVLTLGLYRFWMKTRLRRFYWSAITPGGTPLEYTGTGIEKLMGFLIAVVFLAFYIGVFNLILMFISFSLVNNSFVAYGLSFVGLIPIYFFAQYRARRYVLARTRWRGLRFGIDPAAWSYAWRAMLHWTATILTLGILLPRQVFWLEKFRIDRTWYGRARFVQGGNWKLLRPAAVHYYIGLALTILAVSLGFFELAGFSLLGLSVPWLLIGYVNFQVQSFHIMAEHKQLGENIRFQANPRTGRVVGIYVLGNFLAGMVLWAMLIVFAIAVLSLLSIFGANFDFSGGLEALMASDHPLIRNGIYIVFGVVYFSVFILMGVLRQVFMTLPLMQHYAETLTIANSHQLAGITQRPRDEFTEAEGFAEALDIGAAI